LNRALRLLILPALVAAGCSDPIPTNPTPPPVAPQIQCPAAQTSQSLDGQPIAISFPDPAVAGGAPPVTASCTPASGSRFAVGSTTVSCSVRDAQTKQDSCSFSVTVTRVPRISATSYAALGDSITAGTVDPPCRTFSPTGDPLADFLLERALITPRFDNPSSYPSVIRNLLAGRYIAQTTSVVNEGNPAEQARDPATFDRLRMVLAVDAPQVLILQEGANDLDTTAQIPAIVSALRAMVREAKGRGVTVFLGTLLPQRGTSCRGGHADVVVPTNSQIRAMAAAEGVDLVDVYQAFVNGPLDALLGVDGLHPTAAGYQVMGQAFFDAIRARLEVP